MRTGIKKTRYDTIQFLVGGVISVQILLFMLSFALPSAGAGFFVAVSTLFGATVEEFAVSGHNSQTIPLLEAPLSPNSSIGGAEVTIVDESAIMPELNATGSIGEDTNLSSGQISLYVVRKGDSLSQIAQMFGVTTNTIIWGNDLADGKISVGQTLVILPITGVQHKVKSGDTIASIAKKYKGDAEEIRQFNGLSVGAKLAVGDTVIVPNGEVAPAVTSSSKNTKTPPPSSYGAPKNPLPVRSVAAGFYIRPVTGGTKTQGIHGYNGIDIGIPVGSPVLASAGGTVIISKSSGWNGGYGNYVVISHNNGTQTLYAHLSKVIVSVGSTVVQGQVIGNTGNSGMSTGPHIHFEIRGAKNPF